MIKKLILLLLLILLIVFGFNSYNDQDSEIIKERITISGKVALDPEVNFKEINFIILHALSGIGFQEHPLYEIESFTSEKTTFSHTFNYDSSGNTGLVVYAWIDLDDDGILCTPTSRIDLAGIDVNELFPLNNMPFTVKINTPCVGPDWFYPSAP